MEDPKMAFSDLAAHAQQYFGSPDRALVSLALVVLSATLSLVLLLYRLALPKPLPGIPYNASSARKLTGDIPAMLSHISQDDGTFISYLVEAMQRLNAPLVQVFIKPMSKPLLVLADFREARDILARRTREFDRSTSSGDLVRGLGPRHHIHLKTTAVWRAQRRLVQDLMTPSFLHDVAGPAIHQNASALAELWQAKCRLAGGRPWAAAEDIDHVATDAVLAFAFGEPFARKHSATRPALEAVGEMNAPVGDSLDDAAASPDEPVEFPGGQVDEVVRATLELVATVKEVQGSPLPDWKWAYVNSKPRIRRATRVKENYISKELTDAIGRLQGAGEEEFVKSAVDHMVFREKTLAAKDGRKPDYFSRVMMDEIFGFIVAGNDTTSTTLSWGIKYLADNPGAQTKLRNAIEASFATANSEGRSPTIQEITGTHIPYLDATIEETLRCAASVPVVDRQAVVDTELLGYHIPKGTVVTCLVTGPSMTSPAFEIDEARRSDSSRAGKAERRDRAWDPDDMALFKPERWLVAGERGDEFDAAAGPQLAFGLGTRQCYGKRLAHLEMRILTVMIVWRFELLRCAPAYSGYKPVLMMTNRPKDCYVRLREVDRERREDIKT